VYDEWQSNFRTARHTPVIDGVHVAFLGLRKRPNTARPGPDAATWCKTRAGTVQAAPDCTEYWVEAATPFPAALQRETS
jgi:hypothetical protein